MQNLRTAMKWALLAPIYIFIAIPGAFILVALIFAILIPVSLLKFFYKLAVAPSIILSRKITVVCTLDSKWADYLKRNNLIRSKNIRILNIAREADLRKARILGFSNAELQLIELGKGVGMYRTKLTLWDMVFFSAIEPMFSGGRELKFARSLEVKLARRD